MGTEGIILKILLLWKPLRFWVSSRNSALAAKRSLLLFFGSVNSAEHMKLFLFSEHFPAQAAVQAQQHIWVPREPGLWNPLQKLSLGAGWRAKPRSPLGGRSVSCRHRKPGMETTSQQQGLHQLCALSSLSHKDLSWRWDFHQHKGHLGQLWVKCTELGQPQPSWGDRNTKLSSLTKGGSELNTWTLHRDLPTVPSPTSPRTATLNITNHKVFNPGPEDVAGISWHLKFPLERFPTAADFTAAVILWLFQQQEWL